MARKKVDAVAAVEDSGADTPDRENSFEVLLSQDVVVGVNGKTAKLAKGVHTVDAGVYEALRNAGII